jgi:Fe-S cluster biogenesis protein NfuA
MSDDAAAMRQRVESALDEVRPALRMDGGDVELVGVDGGVVSVRLLGACGGCPMATMTLVGFVEERLKQRVPEIRRVTSV